MTHRRAMFPPPCARARAASSARSVASAASREGPRVAIVGGGVSGASCAWRARAASDRAATVDVFDAGRALGGRACARREGGDARWDHGSRWTRDGTRGEGRGVEAWTEALEARDATRTWRVTFGRVCASRGTFVREEDVMRRVIARSGGWDEALEDILGECGARVRTSARVVEVRRDARGGGLSVRWSDASKNGEENVETGYDVVVFADKNIARAVGVMDGLDAEDVAREMRAVDSAPSLALMVTLNRAPMVPFVGADIDNDSTLSWIANESSKSGRNASTNCWIALSTERYAREKVTPEALATRPGSPEWAAWIDQVADEMSASFIRLVRLAEASSPTAAAPLEITFARAHRWGAAFPLAVARGARANKFLRSATSGALVYAIGDYCAEPVGTVEGAVASGLACADYILARCFAANSKL